MSDAAVPQIRDFIPARVQDPMSARNENAETQTLNGPASIHTVQGGSGRTPISRRKFPMGSTPHSACPVCLGIVIQTEWIWAGQTTTTANATPKAFGVVRADKWMREKGFYSCNADCYFFPEWYGGRRTLQIQSWNFPRLSKSFAGERCSSLNSGPIPIWSMEKPRGSI